MERGNGGIANFLKGGAINPIRGIFGSQECRSSQAGGSQLRDEPEHTVSEASSTAAQPLGAR